MGRYLCEGYIALVVTSLFFIGHERLELIIASGWLFSTWGILVYSRSHGIRIWRPLFLGLLSQLPSMVAAVISFWSLEADHPNELANGVLELWVNPFMPFLELLPPVRIGEWSAVYIAACFVPIALLAANIGAYYLCNSGVEVCMKLMKREPK